MDNGGLLDLIWKRFVVLQKAEWSKFFILNTWKGFFTVHTDSSLRQVYIHCLILAADRLAGVNRFQGRKRSFCQVQMFLPLITEGELPGLEQNAWLPIGQHLVKEKVWSQTEPRGIVLKLFLLLKTIWRPSHLEGGEGKCSSGCLK